MFGDNTDLDLSHQNINTFFIKYLIYNRKTKYTLFHKKSSKNDLPEVSSFKNRR